MMGKCDESSSETLDRSRCFTLTGRGGGGAGSQLPVPPSAPPGQTQQIRTVVMKMAGLHIPKRTEPEYKTNTIKLND